MADSNFALLKSKLFSKSEFSDFQNDIGGVFLGIETSRSIMVTKLTIVYHGYSDFESPKRRALRRARQNLTPDSNPPLKVDPRYSNSGTKLKYFEKSVLKK